MRETKTNPSQPPATNYAMVVIEFGGANALDNHTLQKMCRAPAMAHTKYPNAHILLSLAGFDNDPRSLWDIPEAAEYVRAYARAAGLNDWRRELFQALDQSSRGLLIACNALDKPHPFSVEIVPDPT